MKILVIFIAFSSVVHGAKVLMFTNYPSVSHQKIFGKIWKALSLSGHKVISVTPNPLNDPKLTNLTEIDVSISYKIFEQFDYSHLRRDVYSPFDIMNVFLESGSLGLDLQVNTKGFQELLRKPSDYFDLLIIECHSPFMFGLQHKFKAPLIAISSLEAQPFMHNVFGNPIHPFLYPEMFGENFGNAEMTIFEKLDNIYVTVGMWLSYKLKFLPISDRIARKKFGNDMPYIEELVRNSSLLLINMHPIFASRRPYAPNVIDFYVVPENSGHKISQDLQKALDDAKNGAVYFSLGTNVRFEHVEGNLKQIILEALGELPYTVLCKWESEDDPRKPNNVILKKWYPQQAILAHPNVKAFVTQGGLQSSEEAISNGVPLVVIPFLGDQPMNAQLLKRHGMAETITPKELQKDILRDTILKIMQEEKYRQRAKELRSIFLDQPQSGLDKVVWWCEYVIRHKGAKHLRSPSADIPLYEYFMLDVFAVIFGVLFVLYKMVQFVLKFLLRMIKSRREKLKKN